MKARILSAIVLVLFFVGGAFAAEPRARTFDALAEAELDVISQSTQGYFLCVSDKLGETAGADSSTPERILATYPPHILIYRQQCRMQLLQLERQMYAFSLNPEFIVNYVNTAREDVVHFALRQALSRAERDKEKAREDAAWERETAPRAEETPAPKQQGFGIFTQPKK